MVKTLITVFEEHVGKTRGELNAALSGCEELGFAYKLVRGLSAVLEDRCVFESRASILPLEARRALFEEASRRVIATEDDRNRALSAVAFRMGISTYDLERSLYADLNEEQELSTFDAVLPSEVLEEYNFALTSALLTHARWLELTYIGRDREIEELVGKLGRPKISGVGGATKVVVEWKPTRRMGYKASQLENILSLLTSRKGWVLVADIVYPLNSGKVNRLEISEKLDGKIIKPRKTEKRATVEISSKHKTLKLPRREIIDIQKEAFRLGLTEDELKKSIMEGGTGYIDMGGVLITKAKRDEIEEALSGMTDMRFKAVRGALRKLGCRNPLPVLEALGYDVEWNRDRDESMVYKIGQKTQP